MADLPEPPILRRQIYSYGTHNVNHWVGEYNHYIQVGDNVKANNIRTNAINEFGINDWNHALNNPPAHGGRRVRRRRSKSRSTHRRHKRKSSKRRKSRRKTKKRKTSRRHKSRRR